MDTIPHPEGENPSAMQLSTVGELVDEIRQGKMVILMDDEDRENEGDLIIAAEHVTAEAINFMAKYGRGLICLPMSKERCERLGLPLMVQNNGSGFGTKFTVTIEAREGITTGISAADRAHTARVAAARDPDPRALVQPGHMFPLMAEPGGVLRRVGHTEAACDLAVMAGCQPAAVICEVMNDDGSMARRDELLVFAKRHGLKICTIASLIQYRAMHEKTIEVVFEHTLETTYGPFRLTAFRDTVDEHIHLALVKGEITGEAPALVRVHQVDAVRDLMGGMRNGRTGWSLNLVLEAAARSELAVVVILGHDDDGAPLLDQVEGFFKGEERPRKRQGELRTYRNIGTGSQILKALGVRKMRLLSAPLRFNALSGFGLEIVEYLEAEA